MFPVVVSDLDGTLLNKQHQLSPRTRKVIRRLSEQGVKFIFATGRHYDDIRHFREMLGIDDMYLVTSNGARAHNSQHQAVVQQDISIDLVKPLLAMRHETDEKIWTNVYSNDGWMIDSEAPWMQAFHRDSGFSYQVVDFDQMPPSGVQKVTFIAESETVLAPMYQRIETLYGDRLSLTSSSPRSFEIMDGGVTKASTLHEVLRLKGLTMEDAIAFGDGMNDLEMLSQVGKGLIMGNADSKLTELLPENEQIGFSHDDAVAEYLEKQYTN